MTHPPPADARHPAKPRHPVARGTTCSYVRPVARGTTCSYVRRAGLTINDLFRRHRHRLTTISADEDRVVRAMTACRTAKLGGSVQRCPDCGVTHYAYHSCRNRHCPTCQHRAREKWVEARMEELLPVPYFHVVFTVPEDLRALALRNKRVVYGILMRAAWETLRDAGRRQLKADLGAFAILHTWGQALVHHPHAHFVVPGGGIGEDGKWKASKPNYLLVVKALKAMYRGKFLEALEKAFRKGELEFTGKCEKLAKLDRFSELLRQCSRKEWVVYTKKPFANPEAVLRYIGNYTHRVAISNNRIISASGGMEAKPSRAQQDVALARGEETVTFRRKDYADGGKQKPMTLPVEVFLRRFLTHVLPKGFVKIRFFGWMAHPVKNRNIWKIREQLGARLTPPKELKEYAPACPSCGSVNVKVIAILLPEQILPESRIERNRPQPDDTS